MRTIYECPIGGTISWLYEATTGDPLTATNLVAKLKPIPSPESDLPGADMAGISLTVAHSPAATGVNAGWLVTLNDTVSAGLECGYYATDTAYDLGSDTFLTNAIIIHIRPGISKP